MKITATHYARLLFFMVNLALIRSAYEMYRIHEAGVKTFSYETIMPYILAIAICGLALLLMYICSIFKKDKWAGHLGVLTIAGLLLIKYLYLT